ncbi:CBS domain-containing protein [Candidatus Bathyarchaeota archaeon]|nr:CBS domain-containing protein [Candidatus Bathyarchaeota archaeon]
MTLKVKDVMVGEVITIEANVTVRKAVRLMNNREIGCLVVVQDGKPAGIVTERDMLKRVLVAGRDPRAVEVDEVMSKPLLFMEPEKEIEEAVKLMFKHKIKKLPVVENERLVGLVTLTDLIRSSEVNKWLEDLPLKKTPRRMKKVIDVYFDPKRRLRKRCPLITQGGLSISCQERKCMWWMEDECAVLKLTKQLSEIVEQ